MSESHKDQLNRKNSVCMYLAMYVCKFDTISLATLYDNGFSGRVRVQNSSRAFNYPCCALARDGTAEGTRVK